MGCIFYKQNLMRIGFKCLFQKFQNEGKDEPFFHCPNVKECAENTDIKCRYFLKQNTVINSYGEGRIELLKYNHDFDVPELVCNIEGEAHARKFMDINGTLIPLEESTRIADLQKSIFKGSKRAQDNYYGYALCNPWTYFVTITLSSASVDRYDDIAVKLLWVELRRVFQVWDKDVRILCVPERHEDNAMHFHALVGTEKLLPLVFYPSDMDMTDFSTFDRFGMYAKLPSTRQRYYLLPYYEKGIPQKSRSGAELFCINFYTSGRNSLAILPADKNNDAAVNYLIQYTTKAGNIGYNKKRYYRTYNLNFKDKVIGRFDEEQIREMTADYNLKTFKVNERFTVYRNFNNDMEDLNEKEKQ